MTTPSKRPRGRPRTKANTELVAALIAKQGALSARCADRINALLASHVRRGDAAREWVAVVKYVRRVILQEFPRKVQAALPALSPADMAVVEERLADAVRGLVVSDEDKALAAGKPLPEEPKAVVKPCSTLATARAQAARLQTRLIELKRRIVKDWRP